MFTFPNRNEAGRALAAELARYGHRRDAGVLALPRGGVPIGESSELDAGISLYLFSDEPMAMRLKKMRQLLSAGVSAHELRTLEDLRDDLARTSPKVWGVEPGNGRRRARDGKGRGRDGKGRGSGGRPRPSVKRA